MTYRALTGFIGKYADEAEALATGLNMIVDQLAIQPQDKAIIKGYIATVGNAPAAIRSWLDDNADALFMGDDVATLPVEHKSAAIDAETLRSAVAKELAEVLPGLVKDHAARLLADGTAFHQPLIESEESRANNSPDNGPDTRAAASLDTMKEAEPVKVAEQVNKAATGSTKADKVAGK